MVIIRAHTFGANVSRMLRNRTKDGSATARRRGRHLYEERRDFVCMVIDIVP